MFHSQSLAWATSWLPKVHYLWPPSLWPPFQYNSLQLYIRELWDRTVGANWILTILDLSYTGLEIVQGQIGRSLLQTGEIHDCKDVLNVNRGVVELCFNKVAINIWGRCNNRVAAEPSSRVNGIGHVLELEPSTPSPSRSVLVLETGMLGLIGCLEN